MVAVIIAEGFEEIEALTPVDMLRRAGVEVITVGIGGKWATGSHGIKIECDVSAEDADLSKIDAVVFPGGMPGALNLDASPFTDKVINAVLKKNGYLAAICASPLIFGRRGLLEGKNATCYPGFEGELRGAKVLDCAVVTDGKMITGRSMGGSVDFAKALIACLANDEKSEAIARAIIN